MDEGENDKEDEEEAKWCLLFLPCIIGVRACVLLNVCVALALGLPWLWGALTPTELVDNQMVDSSSAPEPVEPKRIVLATSYSRIRAGIQSYRSDWREGLSQETAWRNLFKATKPDWFALDGKLCVSKEASRVQRCSSRLD